MMKEAEAIPYEPSRLRGERLLVLAPHPDDEVIACGGLVAQHLRENRKVRIVIATNGAEQGDGSSREEESRRGVAILGNGAEIEFLRLPDRGLEKAGEELAERLRHELRSWLPDLIVVPSPIEIHPDHVALSRAFCELVQSDRTVFAELAVATVAFFEVSQPIRPNALVDITDAAVVKWNAIEAHASQTAVHDYATYARGLNAYRSMTLPPEVRFAEGYWTIDLPKLRTMSFMQLRDAIAEPPGIDVTHEPMPVSVIVRTKNRPGLLREAVESIRKYPAAEIVVVNDGGEHVEVENARVLEHAESRGRSAAANEGVRAASKPFIAFLDDDDLHYADHLPTLTAAAEPFPNRIAWYSDAISAFVRIGESGALETTSRQRFFSTDYDPELLLIDNYIPLPTLLMRRDSFLELEGFDTDFDLFEDWEFLIRLSQRGNFLHVPRVTCEIRHIEGAGSITMQSPEGSNAFRDAKRHVWRKHAELITYDVIADAFERQKSRLGATLNEVVDERGRAHHLSIDLARLEREKQELLAQNQTTHVNATAGIEQLNGVRHALEQELAHRDGDIQTLVEEIVGLRQETQALKTHADNLQRELDAHRGANSAALAEIARLNGLLDMIYKSQTWKLHSMMEKFRGRG
jgi:LmbE family N-acetylglucosaminyl deacetylase/GT2 family glycosyltransferase